MEQEKILMGQKQLQRWHLMKMVEVGKITLKEAGDSYLRFFRLLCEWYPPLNPPSSPLKLRGE